MNSDVSSGGVRDGPVFVLRSIYISRCNRFSEWGRFYRMSINKSVVDKSPFCS
jgi:hypothetical protein